MSTKKELVDELSRLTGEQKKTFKDMSKEKLIILLHETSKNNNLRPTHSKHVWLSTPPKTKRSRRKQTGLSKHVWLVSPRSRPKRKRKSPMRSLKSRRYSSVSPRRYTSRINSRVVSSKRNRSKRGKGVSWGGKHVLLGNPKRRRNSMKVSRSILKPKKGYINVISYSPKKYKSREQIIIDAKTRSPSPTKKSYVDTLSHITGRTKKFYSEWTKSELKERLHATEYENWSPIHGKHVWSPRKRVSPKRVSRKRVSRKRVSRKRVSRKRVSRKRVSRKRVSRKRSTSKVSCKSYQKRNENGRCVNKECKDGKIRDRITKKCRNKKN
jgi:hypothetical protein